MSVLYGIDGCRGGWLVARVVEGNEPGLHPEFFIRTNLQPIFAEARKGVAVVAIDIPIGIPETGERHCDISAREELPSGRKSCVFPVPMRSALPATSYLEACLLNHKASGRRISVQSFGILPKIREIDRLMTPGLQQFVREAHPEVTFAVLTNRTDLGNKKRAEGRAKRLAVLAGEGMRLSLDDICQQRILLGRHLVQVDDLIDAAACVLTAKRIGNRQHVCFPTTVCKDSRKLRMEIVS